jgi:hypothetical protein
MARTTMEKTTGTPNKSGNYEQERAEEPWTVDSGRCTRGRMKIYASSSSTIYTTPRVRSGNAY